MGVVVRLSSKGAKLLSWALLFACSKEGRAPEPPVQGPSSELVAPKTQPVAPTAEPAPKTQPVAPTTEPAPKTQQPDWKELAARLNQAGTGCAALLGLAPKETPNGCRAQLLGHGSTLLIYAETECGGDSCSGNTWAWNARTNGPLRLKHSEGSFEAAPDGSFLLIDDAVTSEEPTATGFTVDFHLSRVNLPSLNRETFAPCMSAKLSPGGRWIVCRNREADVLKVPLSGGQPEVVVRVGSKDVRWVPYALIYPSAVEFNSATRMTYTVDENSRDTHQEFTVAWQE